MSDTIYETLVELLESEGIDYNGTILQKFADRIDSSIESGDLANPDPNFADNYEV